MFFRRIRGPPRATLFPSTPLFREAEQAYSDAARPAGAAGVLIERARALAGTFGRNHLVQAHIALDRAERLLAQDPEEGTQARLLHVRGYTYFRQGEVSRATEALQKAERAFRSVSDASGEAHVLDTLGVLWERNADRERAAMLFARSYALKQREDDQAGLAVTLGNLGRLALHGGLIDGAIEFFRLDLAIARSLGDPRGEAVVLTNLAECALALGRTNDFLLSLYGHVAYHQAQDHLTAYEQVSFPPGTRKADYCLPCQLVAARAARRLNSVES